jgi:hypothetical protein
MIFDPLTQLHLQRGAEHLHRLGPRATGEFIAEVGHRIPGTMPCILQVLGEYRRLTPEMLRAAGGHRFPPRPLRAVPR